MNSASPARSASAAQALPVAMILGSCLSLQFGSVFAIRLFPQLGSFGVTTLRLGLAAIVMAVAIRPKVWLWTREQWRAVVLLGFSFAGMNGAFYAAISHIPMGPAVTIEFLGPLGLAAITSRRRAELGAVAVALLGMSLFAVDDLRGASHLDVRGVLFVLVAALFWALYILASKHTGSLVPGHDGLVVALTVGSLVLLPLGWHGVGIALHHGNLLADALGCALLSSVVPYSLELSALRKLPHAVFGVLLSLEPAVAGIAGWLLLSQGMTLLGVIAIVLVVAASVISTLMAPAEHAVTPSEVAVDAIDLGERDSREREIRRQAALADVEILKRHGAADELDALVAWSSRQPGLPD